MSGSLAVDVRPVEVAALAGVWALVFGLTAFSIPMAADVLCIVGAAGAAALLATAGFLWRRRRHRPHVPESYWLRWEAQFSELTDGVDEF